MGDIIDRRRGVAAAVSLSVIAGLLAGCAGGPATPAPVYLRGATPMAANGPPPPQWRENKIVVVRRGQSLRDIAHANHVPEGALIAANNLKPPYALHTGARLVIPDRGAPPIQQAMALQPAPPPMAAASLQPAPMPPPQMAAAPPRPVPMSPTPLAAAAPATPPSSSGATPLPNIVPLDPPRTAAPPATISGPPPSVPGRNAAATQPPPGGPVQPLATESTGRFPWPVRGRILANYGAVASGTRNEGINIGAPLGTPVRSVDSGAVAYVGNEVKGYGNLVLVKHANGWISAYAHLGDVTVKKGDTVSAGEVIGKVGETGGVGVPQLHFELRRGQKPVDPKEFLEPAGSAAAKAVQKAG